ncbi:MAG: hypothetical protein P8020_16810, partial [Acidobacteriota bacterium]
MSRPLRQKLLLDQLLDHDIAEVGIAHLATRDALHFGGRIGRGSLSLEDFDGRRVAALVSEPSLGSVQTGCVAQQLSQRDWRLCGEIVFRDLPRDQPVV